VLASATFCRSVARSLEISASIGAVAAPPLWTNDFEYSMYSLICSRPIVAAASCMRRAASR
jgi:hypothetical protein